MLTLYYGPICCSMAAHVALEEAEAMFDAQLIDIFKGEHLTDTYREINPRAKVPALRLDDGRVLTETTAILSWIALEFADKKLFGDGALQFAKCVSFCSWLSGDVHGAFRRWVRPELFADGEQAQAEVKAAAKATFWTLLQDIDRSLTDKQWIMDCGFTACDAHALVFYGWGPILELPVTELTAFTAMKNRFVERPKARRALDRENNPISSM